MCYEWCTTIDSRTGNNHRSGRWACPRLITGEVHRSGRVVYPRPLVANDVGEESGRDLVSKAAGVNHPSRPVTLPSFTLIPDSRVTNRVLRRLHR